MLGSLRGLSVSFGHRWHINSPPTDIQRRGLVPGFDCRTMSCSLTPVLCARQNSCQPRPFHANAALRPVDPASTPARVQAIYGTRVPTGPPCPVLRPDPRHSPMSSTVPLCIRSTEWLQLKYRNRFCGATAAPLKLLGNASSPTFSLAARSFLIVQMLSSLKAYIWSA